MSVLVLRLAALGAGVVLGAGPHAEWCGPTLGFGLLGCALPGVGALNSLLLRAHARGVLLGAAGLLVATALDLAPEDAGVRAVAAGLASVAVLVLRRAWCPVAGADFR